MIVVALVLVLLSAAGNGLASVLQRKAARDEPAGSAFSLAMLWHLAHRPAWVFGVLSVLAGFLLQAVALNFGPIALIQPVLVMELPFTLVLAAWILGGRVNAQEWWSVAALSGGLALTLFALLPSGGDTADVRLSSWLVGIGVTLAIVAVLTVAGQRRRGPAGAAALGIATGTGFGLTGVLLKAVTAAYAHGISGVFTSWQTYALVVLGPSTFFLLQNTLQAGTLVASQPGMTLANPVTAVIWGVIVLGEQVRTGVWLVPALAGAALVAGGTVLLARSPLFQGDSDNGKHAGRGREPSGPSATRAR